MRLVQDEVKGVLQGRLPSRRLLMASGALSSILILISSLAPDSQLTSKILGSWFFGMPNGPLTISAIAGVPEYLIFGAGFLLGLFAWWELVRSVREGRYSIRELVWMAAVWYSPLLLAGPLYSRDVYAYAAIGEMVSRHISPYLYGPNILGATPYLNTVDPIWGNAPAPYGPIFLWLSGLVAVGTFHDPFATMLVIRVLAIAATIGVAWLATLLARELGYDHRLALVLVGLNPLIVFHLASSAHNDLYMMLFLLAGLLAYARRHPIVAVVLVSLAVAVKVPAVVALAFIAWGATPGNDLRTKIRPALTYGAIALVTVGVVSAATGLGWGWIHNLGTPGLVLNPAVPTTAITGWVNRITSVVGLSPGYGTWLTIFRALGLAAAGTTGLYFVVRFRHFGLEKAIGYSLLALVLFGPVIQSWYIAWGVVVLATMPTKRVTYGVVGVSVLGMVYGLPYGGPIVAWTAYGLIAAGALWVLAARFSWTPVNAAFGRVALVAGRFAHPE